jgi:hypothetical protein
MPVCLPGYAAEAALVATPRPYGGALGRLATVAGRAVVAQLSPCDPCDICGDERAGGGVRPPPMACPVGERCCGRIIDGRCVGQCVAINAKCP